MRFVLVSSVILACSCIDDGSVFGGGDGGGSDQGTGGSIAATGGSSSSGGGTSAAGGGSIAASGGGFSSGGGGTSTDGGSTGGGVAATGGGTSASGGGSTYVDAGDPYSTDRNLFFGASRCADAGFALCDDFESGSIDTSVWSKAGGQFLSVGTSEHARGGHALHIHIPGDGGVATNGAAYLRETKTFPTLNNTYWGRAFYKFVQIPSAPGMSYAHWTIIGGSGDVVAGEIRVSAQLSGGKNLFGVGTDNRTQDAGTGDWTNSDKDPNNMPRAVPTDEWECLEWLHDGQNNETRFFWDDVEHPSLHTTASMHGGIQTNPYLMPQFTQVFVGFQEYQASTEEFEMWVDEIAINPTRVGCVR